MHQWDIKIVVIIGLGAAALGIYSLLEYYTLNSVPDENVVYIDPTVGRIDGDPRSGKELQLPDDAQGSGAATD